MNRKGNCQDNAVSESFPVQLNEAVNLIDKALGRLSNTRHISDRQDKARQHILRLQPVQVDKPIAEVSNTNIRYP